MQRRSQAIRDRIDGQSTGGVDHPTQVQTRPRERFPVPGCRCAICLANPAYPTGVMSELLADNEFRATQPPEDLRRFEQRVVDLRRTWDEAMLEDHYWEIARVDRERQRRSGRSQGG